MRRMILALVVGLLLAPAGSASAQTPIGTPTSSFAFEQSAPDAKTAQSYTFKLYVDGSATGQALPTVTCVAGPSSGVQTCTAPFPAFTPGTHAVQLTASNAAGESPKSASFTFTLVAIPGAPQNLRIVGSGSSQP